MSKQERSPSYPSFTLQECIESIRKLYGQAGRTAMDREPMAKVLGYASLNGSAVRLMAALTSYGLLEKEKAGKYKVSEQALKILKGTDIEKSVAIAFAWCKPKALAMINEKYAECSESVLAGQLVINDGFTDDGATKAASIYYANRVFADEYGRKAVVEDDVDEEISDGEDNESGSEDGEKSLEKRSKVVENVREIKGAAGSTTHHPTEKMIAECSAPLAGNQLRLSLSGPDEVLPEDIEDIDVLMDYLKRQLRKMVERQAKLKSEQRAETQPDADENDFKV